MVIIYIYAAQETEFIVLPLIRYLSNNIEYKKIPLRRFHFRLRGILFILYLWLINTSKRVGRNSIWFLKCAIIYFNTDGLEFVMTTIFFVILCSNGSKIKYLKRRSWKAKKILFAYTYRQAKLFVKEACGGDSGCWGIAELKEYCSERYVLRDR